ncbi:hypothetical protein GCM10009630_18390 [Kribbella jejuensis]|uniref:4-hydroxy-3-methylbut-2-enyl diphosphate reductase n=1 Tax=Kribbella jejuensis TaxID=236068 RepID=A0A542ELR1_9ACTN|nr:4-hydroxy-3-methylbut-2-enyl diphosphate reductase [Kribbella jejuensis]TQJ16194.1 4-hydroxy-3-methylbut-2-enyl diphosphate reductase [Kribbella jejuensis]
MTGVVVHTPLYAEWIALRGVLRTPPLRTGRAAGTPTAGPALIAGVAGALVEGISPGDLVVASAVRRPGRPDEWVPSHAASLIAGELRRHGFTVHLGPVVTADRVVDSAPARAELAASGAIAVDTESGLLAGDDGQSVVIRAIVDTPAKPLRAVGLPARGVRALRALRRTGGVIEDWRAAVGDRHILLAGPRSFCAGVERAIETVERALERFGAPVYVRRQIVHNRYVVEDLERRGAVFVEEVDAVPEGSLLVLAAHGVAPAVRAEAAARRLRVVDATCPLVAKVHQEVRRYAARDDTVVLIGHAEHEEVVGTIGEAPGQVLVVSTPDEAATVDVPDPSRVAYAMQTTLAVEDAAETVAVLRRRFPGLKGPRTDDICYATSNRQAGVRRIARQSDLVVVLGSQNSSNSRRLAEVAEAAGAPAVLIDTASELPLKLLAGATTIGVTAGASAPPALVDDLVRCLSGLGSVTVTETGETTEDIRFVLPKEVNQP